MTPLQAKQAQIDEWQDKHGFHFRQTPATRATATNAAIAADHAEALEMNANDDSGRAAFLGETVTNAQTATAAALRSIADAIEAGLLPLPDCIDMYLLSADVSGARLLTLADQFGEKIGYAPSDEDRQQAQIRVDLAPNMPSAARATLTVITRDVGELYHKGYADHNQRCLAPVPE